MALSTFRQLKGRCAGRRRSLGIVLALVTVSVLANPGCVLPNNNPGPGGAVVINEISYNPGDDDGPEFIELFNPYGGRVDLAGACFTGITFCFGPGSGLDPGAFMVLTSDTAAFSARWGSAADGVFTGGLSNGGEKISVRDAALVVLDEVTYDDGAPWPGVSDGDGPSLEVLDAKAGNHLPQHWAASNGAPTPRADNSRADGSGPYVAIDVTHPIDPPGGAPIIVTATSNPSVSSMSLRVRVGFEPEQLLPMVDDGASGDGAAGDGTFGATIPAQPSEALVRYRVEAIAGGRQSSSPRPDDSQHFHGVVVKSGLQSQLPIFRWFIAPDDYAAIIAVVDPPPKRSAVLAVNGRVFDNITIRRRGNASRTEPKKSWEVELPAGYLLDDPMILTSPVDEFALDRNEPLPTTSTLGWLAATQADLAPVQAFPVRLEQNGSFYGLYSFVDGYDNRWRDANGFGDDDLLYKKTGVYELRHPDADDGRRLTSFRSAITGSLAESKQDELRDQLDVPALVNYYALALVIRHFDSATANHYLASDERSRWRLLLDDLDNTFNMPASFTDSLAPVTDRELANAFWYDPVLREMYLRRVRTLADHLLAPGVVETVVENLLSPMHPEMALDVARWGTATPEFVRTVHNNFLADQRNAIFVDGVNTGLIPPAQTGSPPIAFTELHYNPGTSGTEFVELHNPNATAVDVSGWAFDRGITVTLPPGSVIPAHGEVVVVQDDNLFRDNYPPGRLVLAQYSGSLSDSGEAVRLVDRNGATIDELTYDDAAPWPVAPDGSGTSLELIDPQIDNSNPANWRSSTTGGGTPARPNTSTVSSLRAELEVAEASAASGATLHLTLRLTNDGSQPLTGLAIDGASCTSVPPSLAALASATISCTMSAPAPPVPGWSVPIKVVVRTNQLAPVTSTPDVVVIGAISPPTFVSAAVGDEQVVVTYLPTPDLPAGAAQGVAAFDPAVGEVSGVGFGASPVTLPNLTNGRRYLLFTFVWTAFGPFFQGTPSAEVVPRPTISIADRSVPEGDSGSNNGSIDVTLSSPSDARVDVNVQIVRGPAGPQDVGLINAFIAIPPGSTSLSVTLPVIGDTVPEPDTSFTVVLADPVNAVISDGSATVTILDDD